MSQESPTSIRMMPASSCPWSTQATFTLLEKVRDREELWNIKHPAYHGQIVRRRLFEEIGKELKAQYPALAEITTDDALFRFAYLRGNFQKHLRRVEKSLKGSGRMVSPKWKYYKGCSFLTPVYSNTTNASSIQLLSNTKTIYEGTLKDLLDAQGNADFCFYGNSSASLASSSPSPSQTPTVRPQSGNKCMADEHPHEEEDTPTSLSTSSTPFLPPSPAVVAPASATQPLASTSQWTPRSHKKLKCRDNNEMVQETIVQTLQCMQEMMKAQERKQTVQYDLATQTVMAFMQLIPDSHEQVKYEFTQKILSLVAEYLEKIF